MNDFKTYTVTPEEKRDVLVLLKTELEKREDIVFAYVFGSFVEPDIPFFRDIDVGVYVRGYRNEDWSRYYIDLPVELQRLLEYRYPVDSVVINDAGIALQSSVLSGELLFTKDEELWTEFAVLTAAKYNDIAPVFNHYFKEAFVEE